MAQLNLPPLTFDQFFDWERRREFKHEFVDGEAVAPDNSALKNGYTARSDKLCRRTL